MPAAAPPPNEAERICALRAHRVLDSPTEAAFDELTRQAKEICACPVALISLVDEKRQWFKSRIGLGMRETPRDQSICAHALLTPDRPLIVADTLADSRFFDNPIVTQQPKIRFYAGIPLRSLEGYALGTLCVLDHVPRQLSSDQIDKLRALAQQVSIRLSLRRYAPAERWLATGFVLGLTLLLCMALYFTVHGTRFLSSEQWVAHTTQVVRNIEHVLFEVQAAESSQRGFTASGQEAHVAPFQAAVSSLPVELTALRKAISDNPAQEKRFTSFQAAIQTKLAIMQERFDQRRALGMAALDPKYLDGSGRRSMQTIIDLGQGMIEVENGLLRQRAAARANGLRTSVELLLSTSAVAGSLLGTGFLLTRRELRRSHALGGALAQANFGLESEIADRQRAQERLGVQHAVARIAAESVSLAEAAPLFLQCICERLDWTLGELWTVDPASKVMRLADHWYSAAGSTECSPQIAEFIESSRRLTFAQNEGLPGRAWTYGHAAWEHDLAESRYFLRTAEAQKAGLRRAFAFPLRASSQEQVTSVMVFLSKEQGAPDVELVAAMDTVAGQIAQFAVRCRAEAGLRASQARFSAFIENAPAVAYIKDEDGRMLYGNETLLRTFGLRQDEWLGKTDADFWPEFAPAIRAHDKQVLSGESAVELRESVPLPGGRMSHWLSYKFPLYDEATGRKMLAGMSLDITAREQTEAALRREREFLATLLDNLQAGVVACDSQGTLTHCNRAASAFHGFPADAPVPPFSTWGEYFELLSASGGESVREENRPLELALQGEVTRDHEFIVRPKHGPERALSLNAAPFEDDYGRRLGAVSVIYDVTARRQAREDALQSLREKEMLLQEVHHRVKNNLQIIGSLLSMQARRTKSPVALEALRESAGRVRSIALVHEKLYRSTDLECIEAADYLRTLSRHLMDALGSERLRLQGRVALDFELEEGYQLDASIAIACGLIVNEALTNSFKHGFPDGRSGRVTVGIRRLAEAPSPVAGLNGDHERIGTRLRLEVRDDGVGLPAAAMTPAGTADLARNSLGLRLVRDLSKQVNGRFEFANAGETTGTGLALRVDFDIGAV